MTVSKAHLYRRPTPTYLSSAWLGPVHITIKATVSEIRWFLVFTMAWNISALVVIGWML